MIDNTDGSTIWSILNNGNLNINDIFCKSITSTISLKIDNNGSTNMQLLNTGVASVKEINIHGKTLNVLRVYNGNDTVTANPILSCQIKPNGNIQTTALSVGSGNVEVAYIRDNGVASVSGLYIGNTLIKAYKETIALNFVNCNALNFGGNAVVLNWKHRYTLSNTSCRLKISVTITAYTSLQNATTTWSLFCHLYPSDAAE